MSIKISQLTTINGADIDDADLFAIVDIENNSTDKVTLGTLKALIGTSVYKSGALIVDPVNGDDGTALPYRLDKAYATPAAALADAVAGDVIELYAGVHNFYANAAKDGVSYYACQGADIYAFTTLLNYDTTIFGGVTLTTPAYFTGYGRIVYCSGNLINVKSNPGALVTLEFNDVNVNNISNGILAQDGLIYFKSRNNYICAGRNYSCRSTGNIIADVAGETKSTFVNVNNGVFWISGTSYSGIADIKSKSFVIPVNVVGGNSCHIYADNLLGCTINITLDELIDTSSVAQAAIKINNAFTNTSGKINIRIKKANTLRPLYNILNPVANIIMQVDDGDSAASSISAGVVLVKNSLLKNTNGKVIDITNNGVLYLMSSTIVSDGIATTIDVGNTASLISEGSKGNVIPVGSVTGNFYVNPLYIN